MHPIPRARCLYCVEITSGLRDRRLVFSEELVFIEASKIQSVQKFTTKGQIEKVAGALQKDYRIKHLMAGETGKGIM